MKKMINTEHISGYVYNHSLVVKQVQNKNSENYGKDFISGELNIATDEEGMNVIPVHFTFVTPTTKTGAKNNTYTALNTIIEAEGRTWTTGGKDSAIKVSVNTSIALNDFINNEGEKISVMRNEGGFVHLVTSIDDDEKRRNTFKCDIVITNVRDVEADEERGLPAKAIIKGAIFDFRKSLLPVEFSAVNPNAIDYFQSLEASPSNPVFTSIWGRQISETVVKKIVTESAFGEDEVREVKNTHKDWVVTGAAREEYLWDSEDTITADELRDAMKERELYLSEVKQRSDEYKASKNSNSGVKEAEFKF